MHFAIYGLLFFLTTTTALAGRLNCNLPQKDALQIELQEHFGKAEDCGAISLSDLRVLDKCSMTDAHEAINKVNGLSGLMNDTATNIVFQEMVRSGHQQAVCRSKFIDEYENNTTQKSRLNLAAKNAFERIPDLRAKILDAAKLESDYKQLRDSLVGTRASIANSEKAKWEELIRNANNEVRRRIQSIPLGYDPQVYDALVEMGRNGNFDEQKFGTAISLAKNKYIETRKYYLGLMHDLPGGAVEYCTDLSFRNRVGRNGQLKKYLGSMIQASPETNNLLIKLQCRLDRTYNTGQSNLQTAVAAGGVGSLLIPGIGEEEAAAVAVNGVRTVGNIIRAGLVVTLKGLAAVDAAYSAQQQFEQCFPPKAMITGTAVACDPKKEFDYIIETPKLSACALGAVSTGNAVVAGVKVVADGSALVKAVTAGRTAETVVADTQKYSFLEQRSIAAAKKNPPFKESKRLSPGFRTVKTVEDEKGTSFIVELDSGYRQGEIVSKDERFFKVVGSNEVQISHPYSLNRNLGLTCGKPPGCFVPVSGGQLEIQNYLRFISKGQVPQSMDEFFVHDAIVHNYGFYQLMKDPVWLEMQTTLTKLISQNGFNKPEQYKALYSIADWLERGTPLLKRGPEATEKFIEGFRKLLKNSNDLVKNPKSKFIDYPFGSRFGGSGT